MNKKEEEEYIKIDEKRIEPTLSYISYNGRLYPDLKNYCVVCGVESNKCFINVEKEKNSTVITYLHICQECYKSFLEKRRGVMKL